MSQKLGQSLHIISLLLDFEEKENAVVQLKTLGRESEKIEGTNHKTECILQAAHFSFHNSLVSYVAATSVFVLRWKLRVLSYLLMGTW